MCANANFVQPSFAARFAVQLENLEYERFRVYSVIVPISEHLIADSRNLSPPFGR